MATLSTNGKMKAIKEGKEPPSVPQVPKCLPSLLPLSLIYSFSEFSLSTYEVESPGEEWKLGRDK